MVILMIRSAIIASVCLLCSVDVTSAQSQSKLGESNQQSQQVSNARQQLRTGQTAVTNAAQQPATEAQKPWKLTSQIHLEKGTNKGYLVVHLDLDKGFHVYSLNPKGSPSPTKLAVMPSNDLKVQAKFVSKTAPKVIKEDPVFKQRIEKHSGQVQFFAPIIVRPGIDLQKLTQEVQFSGQICSDSACQPIRNQTATATFAGFFELPKPRNAAETKQLK